MSMNPCCCYASGAKTIWIDRVDVGFTAQHWDITCMRCAGCGRPWLRAFFEHEAFSRSGRFYRVPSTDAALKRVTPDEGLSIIEQAPFKIAGGSLFGGMERVIGDLIGSGAPVTNGE